VEVLSEVINSSIYDGSGARLEALGVDVVEPGVIAIFAEIRV